MSGADLLVQFFCKPSAIESEIHPSHKSSIYTLGISRLHRAVSPSNKFARLIHLTKSSQMERVAYGYRIINFRCDTLYAPERGMSSWTAALWQSLTNTGIITKSNTAKEPENKWRMPRFKRGGEAYIKKFLYTDDKIK